MLRFVMDTLLVGLHRQIRLTLTWENLNQAGRSDPCEGFVNHVA